MLSAIIDAGEDAVRLEGLLVALTPAAVEGVVRDVLIVDAARSDLVAEAIALLCDETGAKVVGDFGQAFAQARSDWLLAAPAAFRPRAGWVEALAVHMRDGRGQALLRGEGGGLFNPAPVALVVAKDRARALVHPDLKALRRQLGPTVPRIG